MQRRGLVWLLLAALLWALLLGQLHRVSHGHAGPQHAAHVPHTDASQAAAHHDEAHAAWSAFLFNHDDGSEGCRLYDQLTCADVLGVLPQLVLPLLLAAFLFRRLERNAVARRTALFEARGPPVLH